MEEHEEVPEQVCCCEYCENIRLYGLGTDCRTPEQ